jgi:hypothetical protein
LIPRDLIEMIYVPDWSRVPNANPNWPHDLVVRLDVRWPEFTASPGVHSQEQAKRKIIVSLIEGTVRTVTQQVERLNELRAAPEISGAGYGLKELRSDLSKGFREYIASPDHGPEYLIHCDQSENEKILYHSCTADFEYLDLKVNLHFNSPFLSDWREIHRKTVNLLDSMRRD